MSAATALLRWRFELAHRLLEADFEVILLHAAAPYARVTVCEDVIVNGILARQTPMAFSSWRGGTGLSELPPLVTPAGRDAWAEHVRVDLVRFRAYARAVHAATNAYLAQLDARGAGESQMRVLVALLLKVSSTHSGVATLQGG